MCSRICLFVVFKQKTSYEMRISDWSSDVCSSDLPITNHCSVPETNTTRAKEQQCRSNRLRNWVAVETKNRCREISATITIFCQTINNNERHIKRDLGKIGRASSRERVCKYVEISLVSVPLTKKKTKQKSSK